MNRAKWTLPPLAEAQLAYAAGFIDGEGSILIRRCAPRPRGITINYSLALEIANTNRAVLDLLRAWFGGAIYALRRPGSRKQAWQLTLRSRHAYNCLCAIRPYLIVKAAEADIAVSLQQAIDRHPNRGRGRGPGREALSPATVAEREILYQQLLGQRRP